MMSTPKTHDLIKDYHVHLYYGEDTLEEARSLAELLRELYPVKVGTFHQKPVGPHPVWSCQITVSHEELGEVIPWLLLNHGHIDVFIHPNTGDPLLDHTRHVMWIGESYPLNISIFQSQRLR